MKIKRVKFGRGENNPKIQENAVSIESFIRSGILIDSPEILQRRANLWKCAFRWNGRTYNGFE